MPQRKLIESKILLTTEILLLLIIGVSLVFGPWCRPALGFGEFLGHDLFGQL